MVTKGKEERASIEELTREHTRQAPIVEALVAAADNIRAPFFFPGHKMGRGLPSSLPGPFATAGGAKGGRRAGRDAVWQYDLPEIPELDNLFAPEVCGPMA